ncbi:MAG: gliding motility-associated C-terminal domain-containing protein [Crocinitomicaceae bacterium]|nr:gliding motility-associated C-terminal domain-containing protein [Flavobacteriales bacterium]NQZ38140.1 gliding motility-associated C-terminal domain-containing protein [Crocinitomicaceae bacterium]
MSKLFLFVLLTYFAHNCFAQGCENTDFEYGNFTNWTGYIGTCCGGAISTPGIVNGRHTIITNSTLDPNTNNMISTMPPVGGGAYSVRLGNDNVGSQAERLTRSFVVNADNELFIYQYALVLEDPNGHPPIDKPKFEVRVFDENGDIINPAECGYYQVTAGPETSSWGLFGTVRYKDWSTVGIDLSQYFGTLITIEFTVQDCGWGGHFGYAYLDASCGYLDITVIGFCTGSTTVTLIGPDGFDSYYWPHSGETTQTVVIPVPNVGDSVTVEVMNQSGCATSVLHVFEEYPLPFAVAGNDTTICAGQEVDIWSDGGGVNGVYDWYANGTFYTSQQNISVTPLETTIFEVHVANANGCYSADSLASVIVTVDTTLLFELPADTTICTGEPITFSGPVGPYTYLWYTSTDTLGVLADLVDTPLESTTYYLNISNSSCSYMDSVLVEVYGSGTLDDSLFLDFCFGATSFTIVAPDSFATYNWDNGMTTQTIVVDPYVSDTLWLDIISPFGCVDSITYILSESFPVTPSISTNDSLICIGHSALLSASSSETNSTYNWTSIPSGFSGSGDVISVSPATTTSYIVEVITPAGCFDSNSYDTVTIQIDSSAYFTFDIHDIVCEGQTDSIVGPGGMSYYEWYFASNILPGDSVLFINPVVSGNYYLLVESGNCSYSDFVYVPVNQVNTTTDIEYLCVTSTSITLDAPVGYSSYFWTLNGTTLPSNTINSPTDLQEVTVYAADSDNCVDTINFIIDILPLSVLTPLIDETVCIENGAVLLAQSSYSFDQYTWTSIPPGTSSNVNPLLVMPQIPTQYVVELSNYLNCIGDPYIDTVLIIPLTDHVINIAPVAICDGEVVNLSSPGTVGDYFWDYFGETSDLETISFTPNTNGFVTLTVSDGACVDVENIPITVYQLSTYNVSNAFPEICAGESNTLSINPSNYSSIQWLSNGNLLGTNSNITQSPSSTTTYIAEIIDVNGCGATASGTIVVNPIPSINLGPDLLICDVLQTTLGPISTQSGLNYFWSTLEQSSEIVVSSSGTYLLTVDLNGCLNNDEIIVEFQPYSHIGIIPNVITANDDGINDDFFIDQTNLAEYHIIIINRWGAIVFEATNPVEMWDGTNKNSEVAEGVYFYLIDYRLQCEEESVQLQGNITVTR